MYAKHLQEKQNDWLDSEDILVDEQAGFKVGQSTLDHALVLQHLVEKYTHKSGQSLYAAFLDFRPALTQYLELSCCIN